MAGMSQHKRANLFGCLWMIVAMGVFAIEDAFIKAVSVSLPIGQVLILFGLGGAVIFAVLARLNDQSLFSLEVVSPLMGVRAVFEITGRLFYFLAITLTPLSSASVILQTTPLVVVIGAAWVFNEQVGWRRWMAIIIGLIGVIVIVQPGTESFSAHSILAFIGVIGFAGRDLASRAAPAELSASILGLYGFLSVVVAGILYSIWQGSAFVVPNTQSSLQLLGAIGAGVIAYSCLMNAMRTGEVSTVTPFRYTRLLFGITLGVFVFAEDLSANMALGSCFIILSGLLIVWHSKRQKF